MKFIQPNDLFVSVYAKWQVDFCYVNSKSNRKKLVRGLFSVPRTSLELLPYYSRMVATLSSCMKDIAPALLQLLEEEFNFLINKKVIQLERKTLYLHIIWKQLLQTLVPVNRIK